MPSRPVPRQPSDSRGVRTTGQVRPEGTPGERALPTSGPAPSRHGHERDRPRRSEYGARDSPRRPACLGSAARVCRRRRVPARVPPGHVAAVAQTRRSTVTRSLRDGHRGRDLSVAGPLDQRHPRRIGRGGHLDRCGYVAAQLQRHDDRQHRELLPRFLAQHQPLARQRRLLPLPRR